jgi:hypothetical protein
MNKSASWTLCVCLERGGKPFNLASSFTRTYPYILTIFEVAVSRLPHTGVVPGRMLRRREAIYGN